MRTEEPSNLTDLEVITEEEVRVCFQAFGRNQQTEHTHYWCGLMTADERKYRPTRPYPLLKHDLRLANLNTGSARATQTCSFV